MIEIRKVSNTQLDGVSLYIVFYNGTCKKVYARDEKEAEEKVRAGIKRDKEAEEHLGALITMLDTKEPEVQK